MVFLQTVKTGQAGNTLVYGLANLEEIEVNADTVNKFLAEECDDEDDHGIEMTMFYYDNNRRCGQFSAVCNGQCPPSFLRSPSDVSRDEQRIDPNAELSSVDQDDDLPRWSEESVGRAEDVRRRRRRIDQWKTMGRG